MIVDLFLVYQFIKRLATPFKEWDAYEMGIIDEKGNQLKKRNKFTKQAEHDAFGIFDIIAMKLKRLLEKVPGGKSRIGSYAAALWLMKEYKEMTPEEAEMLSEEVLQESIQTYMMLSEESIANVTSNVAGMTPDSEPGLNPKQMKKYKNKNKSGREAFATFIRK
jgi:hypothetical protein